MSEEKRDWIALKTEYAREKISLSEFAQRHEIPYSTLIKRARKEKWDEERSNYGQIVVKKIYNRMSNADAKKFAKYESGLRKALDEIDKAIKNGEFNKYRVDIDGQPNDTVRLDMINAEHAERVIELLGKVGAQLERLIGILPAEKIREFELEKMRIEADVLADEEASAEGSMQIGFEADVEECAK